MRFLAVISLLVTLQVVSAEVLWQKSYDSNGPTTGYISSLTRDTDTGHFYAQGREGGEIALWKFNENGTPFYRVIVPSGKLFVGRHNDFFIFGGDTLSRHDSSTGSRIWSVSLANYTYGHCDENGDFYCWNFIIRGCEKRSHVDGHALWGHIGSIIPLSGPDLLLDMESGLNIANKITGALTPISLPVSVSGRLTGVPLPGGKALLFNYGTRRLFGFRGRVPVYNLGFLEQPYGDIVPASDGTALARASWNTMRFDETFKRTWSVGSSFDFSSGPSLIRMGDPIGVTSLATGLGNELFNHGLAKVECAIATSSTIWVGGSLERQSMGPAAINKIDRQTHIATPAWRSSSTGRREDEPVHALLGPGSDLILVSRSAVLDTEISRIRASDGTRRWAIRLPNVRATLVSSSTNTNKSILSLTLAKIDGVHTYEIDLTRAKVIRDFEGYGWITGTTAFRQSGLWTHKFDLSTGNELWRIPRLGAISTDGIGNVFIGSSKNSAVNGELLWRTSFTSQSPATIVGDRVFLKDNYRLACLNSANGSVLWVTSVNASFDLEQPTVKVSDQIAYVRNEGSNQYQAHNLHTGQLMSQRTYGFFDATGAYFCRQGGGTDLYRYDDFSDLTGDAVASFAGTPKLFVSDQVGGQYVFGIDGTANPWDCFVARLGS
ncbi:MAG: PQQ-binding-like beta-propeller repeat protein [Fimbriimonadaceae bacterium]